MFQYQPKCFCLFELHFYLSQNVDNFEKKKERGEITYPLGSRQNNGTGSQEEPVSLG